MRKYLYIIPTVIVILTSSCEEKIDFDLNNNENSRLVVEANLTDQTKAHIVSLTRTSSYYDNQAAPKEKGASVMIFDGTVYHNLTETSAGIYETAATYKGEIGKTYTLNIETENGQSYSSSSKIERVAIIDSISFTIEELDGEDGEKESWLILSHYGDEPVGVGDHYLWLGNISGVGVTEKASTSSILSDQFSDGNYMNGIDFKAYNFIDLPDVDTLKMTVEMHSISKDYFDFILALFTETEGAGGLFAGPPANISSNISNGGLGFFRASAVSNKYLEIPLNN